MRNLSIIILAVYNFRAVVLTSITNDTVGLCNRRDLPTTIINFVPILFIVNDVGVIIVLSEIYHDYCEIFTIGNTCAILRQLYFEHSTCLATFVPSLKSGHPLN